MRRRRRRSEGDSLTELRSRGKSPPMSVGENHPTPDEMAATVARAQWLLDHPEEAQQLVGHMLERQAAEIKRQRFESVRALFETLCKDARDGGQLSEQQQVDPTWLSLCGCDTRTGKAIRFTLESLSGDEQQRRIAVSRTEE